MREFGGMGSREAKSARVAERCHRRSTLGSWLEEQTVPLLEWAFVMLLLEEQAVPLLEWAFVMLLLEEQAVPLLEWAVGR